MLNDPVSGIDTLGLAKKGGPWHPPSGVKIKCKFNDTCSQIKGKIFILLKMIKSHEGWDRHNPYPRGGNRHASEIADLWRAYANCQNLEKIKCIKNSSCDGLSITLDTNKIFWSLVSLVSIFTSLVFSF